MKASGGVRYRANREELKMATSEREKVDVVFEIKEHIGVITAFPTGWNKELNIVAWNEGVPKYDIRDWDADHEHMSRGVTLHNAEMKKVMELLDGREI
jgi:hypothetical protein